MPSKPVTACRSDICDQEVNKNSLVSHFSSSSWKQRFTNRGSAIDSENTGVTRGEVRWFNFKFSANALVRDENRACSILYSKFHTDPYLLLHKTLSISYHPHLTIPSPTITHLSPREGISFPVSSNPPLNLAISDRCHFRYLPYILTVILYHLGTTLY